MGEVTNVILTWGLEDTPPEIRVGEVVDARGFRLRLVQSCCSGGSKVLEHNIATGAMNHLDLPDFVSRLKAIKWEEPEHVRLFVCEQEDDAFSQVPL